MQRERQRQRDRTRIYCTKSIRKIIDAVCSFQKKKKRGNYV